MGTNLFTLHRCGSCGLPIEKTCLCSVHPLTTQQTSTTVATTSVQMVLYEHVEDSQELFL